MANNRFDIDNNSEHIRRLDNYYDRISLRWYYRGIILSVVKQIKEIIK